MNCYIDKIDGWNSKDHSVAPDLIIEKEMKPPDIEHLRMSPDEEKYLEIRRLRKDIDTGIWGEIEQTWTSKDGKEGGNRQSEERGKGYGNYD